MQIDLKSDRPIYEQIYEYFKDAILEGRFKKGEKLPSKRTLARDISVAVNTVTSAYEMLISEGYIRSEEKRGYFANDIGTIYTLKHDDVEISTRKEKKSYKYSFLITQGDPESYPIDKFKKIFTQELIYDEEFYERDYQGLYGLRHEIKNYLFKARGIKTNEDNIIISSGLEYLLMTLFLILQNKVKLALENPGYKVLETLLRVNGIAYEPIDIDESGMSFENFLKADCELALLTPSNQFPTATVMPIKRRLEFLNWANAASGRYIIEDDYDSEFRYAPRAISPIKSLDEMDRVIYIGNFSKSISPLLRVSYMVLPNALLHEYHGIRPLMNSPVSNIVQILVKDFMKEGHFERQLNRMKGIYNRKRLTLLDALKDASGIRLVDSMAGMHLKLYMSGLDDYSRLVQMLDKRSVKAETISSYTFGKKSVSEDALLLGYGLMSEKELESAAAIVLDTIKNLKNL